MDISRVKNAIKAFDQFSTLVERQHNRAKRKAAAKKNQKAKAQESSSLEESDDMSIHVMSPAEIQKVHWNDMRKELRAILQRHNKHKVSSS